MAREPAILPLDEAIGLPHQKSVDLILLDDALERLAKLDERQCRIVELRFFAGLSLEETSVALGISEATVSREWTTARLWLRHEIAGTGTGMTPERWQQVKEVLDGALHVGGEERAAFLGRACQTDPSLRIEVDALLASAPEVVDEFLKSAPPQRMQLAKGSRLGPYEIDCLVGFGRHGRSLSSSRYAAGTSRRDQGLP